MPRPARRARRGTAARTSIWPTSSSICRAPRRSAVPDSAREPRLVDLLGETGDRRALVAELLLQARDVVAQLALDGADPARADRHNLGLHRFADAARSARVSASSSVRARSAASISSRALCAERAASTWPSSSRMLRRIVSTSAARSPGGLRRGELLREPRGHRGRERGARRLRERRHGGLRILAGRQLGELRVTRVEHGVEPRRETFAVRALRRLVMLALEIRPDEVARGLALRRPLA